MKRGVAWLLLVLASAAGAADAPVAPDPSTLTPEQRAAEEQKARAKLEAVRGEQRALEAARAATRGEQAEAQAKLRETELAISAGARELRRLEDELGRPRSPYERAFLWCMKRR